MTANNGIIITNGVRRVGLHTVYDKAWEPVWTKLERTNSLWQSFSRNDVVVREGRVLDPANNPVPTAAELAEEEEEIAAGMGLGADFTVAHYEDGIGVPAMGVGAVGDAALPPFEGILQDSDGDDDAPVHASTAGVAAAAAAPQPLKKKRKAVECSVCKVTTHRFGSRGELCYTAYAEQRRKKQAAVACAAASALRVKPSE